MHSELNTLKDVPSSEEKDMKEAECIMNIGRVYQRVGNHQKAIDFYNKSSQKLESSNTKPALELKAAILNNIGNAQYRRNWLEPKDQWYDGNTLYFPEPALFNCTLEQQFYGGHFDFDAPAITRDIADSGEWIFSRKEIDCIWSQNSFIGCNMARGASTHYKQFMGALLAALEPIWKKHKEQFLCIEGYDKRALAFIAERLITGMVLYREKLFPSMNIATAPIGFVP